MHVPKEYLNAYEWDLNDELECNYICSLENVISALLKSGISLPESVQLALDELAKANNELCDSLHMDGDDTCVFVGKCERIEGDDYIEYLCTGTGGKYTFTVFLNSCIIVSSNVYRRCGYVFKVMNPNSFVEGMGAGLVASLHKPIGGISNPDAWIDRFSGSGIVFYYDNIDKDYVLKLDGPNGALKYEIECVRDCLAEFESLK